MTVYEQRAIKHKKRLDYCPVCQKKFGFFGKIFAPFVYLSTGELRRIHVKCNPKPTFPYE